MADGFVYLKERLRDIMGIIDDALGLVPFGSKTVVMQGGWRQILPVVPRASPAAVVGSSLQKSSLWRWFKTLYLSTNLGDHRA